MRHPTIDRGDSRVVFVSVLLATGVILGATASSIPLVWDEGEYLYRAERIVAWVRLLLAPGSPGGGVHALASHIVHDYWQFVTVQEGHPSWAGIPIALGVGVLDGVVSPLMAARAGPIILFSVACAAVAARVRTSGGSVVAAVVPATVLTLPRLFSDAHFATLDGQLTAWWLLLWAADSGPRRGRAHAVVVGALLGLTCATKFTGIFAALPIIFLRVGAGDQERRRDLLVLLPVAALTFWAVNPPLWHAPLASLVEYVSRNASRPDANLFGAAPSDHPALNVRDYLVGAMRYDMDRPYLPWYNTLAWLAIVTPVPTLALGIVGLRQSLTARDLQSRSLVVHWATLMIVRALPGAPGFDGIRLFLPAFGFWSVLAALGAGRVWHVAGSVGRQNIARAALLTAFVASAINLARYYPQTLSHYNLVVGGVRGASALGLEPTYWWDALDEEALSWLNAHTTPDEAIAFSEIRPRHVQRLQQWHLLRMRVVDPSRSTFKWYVLQNRPSVFGPADRALIRFGRPAFTKYAGHHPDAAPIDLRVPLVLVYSYDDYQRASRR